MAAKGQAVLDHQERYSQLILPCFTDFDSIYSLASKAECSIPERAIMWLAVPSNKRASEVEQYGERAEASSIVEGTGDDEGWVAPPMQTHREDAEEISSSHPAPEAHVNASAPAEQDDDDIPDIEELELEDNEFDEVSMRLIWSPATLQCSSA